MRTVTICILLALSFSSFKVPMENLKMSHKASNYQKAGKLLFASQEEEFQLYFLLFLQDNEAFVNKYSDLMESYGLEECTPLQALYLFGDYKDLVGYVDWRGEENPKELEEFIQTQINTTPMDWTKVKGLRASVKLEEQRDGNFIKRLFKAVDQDLDPMGYQLLFYDLDLDGYPFMVVPKTTAQQVQNLIPENFYAAHKLE